MASHPRTPGRAAIDAAGGFVRASCRLSSDWFRA